MPRKVTEKPYGSGTMTKAAYFSFIRSGLRSKSMRWKPLYDAKAKARRANKSANKRLKWEFHCAKCKKWFPDKEVVVDHIIECGTLTSYEDLPQFVSRLFCEEDGFQVLCKPCHQIKTNEARQKSVLSKASAVPVPKRRSNRSRS